MVLKPTIIIGRNLALGGTALPCYGSLRYCVAPFMDFGVAVGKGEGAATTVEGGYNVTPTVASHVHLEKSIVDGIRALIKEDKYL